MNLDVLLQQVKDAIYNDDKTQYQQGDTSGLISRIEGLFGQHQQSQPQGMDPYGGLPNEAGEFPNVRPSGEEQQGNPAAQEK